MVSLVGKNHSEAWGYTLINSTVDNLIRHFEGQNSIRLYPDFRERKERAQELLFECVGKKPVLFYVRRQGKGKDKGEEIWDLTIATDNSDFVLPKRLKEIKKTLGLKAAVKGNGSGGLKIISVYLLPIFKGQGDAYALGLNLQLIPNSYEIIDIPTQQIKQIAKMPICGNHVPTQEQLQAWKAFLKVEERIAKLRQFCVYFTHLKYQHKQKELTLKIKIDSASLDGNQENYLDTANFWQRVKNAKNQDIKFSDSIPTERNRYTSLKIGSIEKIDPRKEIINIRVEREIVEYINSGNYQLPKKGYIYFDAIGDIKQIERKEKALEQLRQGRTQNPYLGDFLFDASQARPIKKTVKLEPEDLLLSSANPGQKTSVEKVLSAQDLVLIQGPPGTGKTTVIAEICYQIALRGGRTLITSQANLAVDNALSRLVHNPVIRAVRKGKAEKVGEEGQAFLEDKVINNWLENTATDCENNLSQRQENINILTQLLESYQRFTDYLQLETEFNQQQEQLKNEKKELEEICTLQKVQSDELLENLNLITELNKGLKNILKKPTDINWDDEEIKVFLPRLQPYTLENRLVTTFRENVTVVIKYSDELGFVRPQRGMFGLTAWLQETVINEIDEIQAVFNHAHDAILEMSKLAKSVDIFQEKSTYLNQLQIDYQKIQTGEHNLQPTIQIWKNRQREIEYLITEIKEWKSNSDIQIYQVIKDCFQNDSAITDNIFNLPLGLLLFARNLRISIVPNYQLQLPNWQSLNKAIAYEIDGNFQDRKGKQHHFSYFLQQTFSAIPIILELEEIKKWQEIYQQLENYPLLTSTQRKTLIEATQKFLIKLETKYSKAFELKNINLTFQRITKQLKETILENARKCIFKLKKEAEQQLNILEKQQQQTPSLPNNEITEQEIITTQTQVEKANQDANLQLEKVTSILEAINKNPHSPPKLCHLTQEYLQKQTKIWKQHQEFNQQIQSWQNCLTQIENLASSLDAISILSNISESFKIEITQIKRSVKSKNQKIEKFQLKIQELEQQIEANTPDTLIKQRNWWNLQYQEIPAHLKIKPSDNNLFNLDFLNQINTNFPTWEKQLEQEKEYLQKYQTFIQDWIIKIRQPSERDSHDLRQIYLDNANVVGITCVQAANYNFSEEFKSFDVVIIDEVSKCTPPELLIPALKAKKLVMVGDHRQLPPMLDTSTVEEVAENIGHSREEMRFLEESLFKFQFETADNTIKQMLNTQYRMHPQIMGAINQFYDGKLECGILEPDNKRAHYLGDTIIQPYHHLVWVKVPREEQFQEEKLGTSFFNNTEIDIIEKICQQLENTWSSKITDGEPKKEIAVITFYGAQLKKIEQRLESDKFSSLQIRTGTVDRFQGMERPIVIVSMVRNNHQGDVGFANKPERVNVAFSRAQELLIIVGCHDLFTQKKGHVGKMYSQVAQVVSEHGGFIDVSRFS